MKRILGLFIFSILIFIPLACHMEKNIPEITGKPVAWWKFDDIEGPTAFDSSGNNNNGRIYGATWNNGTLSFDGVNDYVRIPNTPSLNPTGSFSIDAWIFPTADRLGHILSKWGDTEDWANQRSYSFHTYFGRRLLFAISDDAHQQDTQFHTWLTPEGVLTLNAWNHVTAVYDKSTGTRKIYVNGTKVAERTDVPINLTIGKADVAIGGYLPSSTTFKYTFPGFINEVKIYNYARSAAEIQADYNYSKRGKNIALTAPLPNLIAWWKFNDVKGTTAFDSSGNNNHGKIYGATWSDKCLYFDGVNDCVKVPDSPVLRPSRITVETWVKVKRISQAVLLEKLPSAVRPHLNGWQIFLNTVTEPKNTFIAGIENEKKGGTIVLANKVIRTGRWYHIAMTYDGKSLNLYVNGVLYGSEPNTIGIGDNSAASLTIGYSEYWNYNYFNGLIKDTKIYNYARSAAQIKADYNHNRQYNPSLNRPNKKHGKHKHTRH